MSDLVERQVASIGEMWASMHEGKPVAEIVAAAVQAERDFNAAEITRLQKALERAREALEPFGNSDMLHAVETGHRESEDSVVVGICDFTVGDLLRAHSVLRALKDKEVAG